MRRLPRRNYYDDATTRNLYGHGQTSQNDNNNKPNNSKSQENQMADNSPEQYKEEPNDSEIIMLLQKINSQLEKLENQSASSQTQQPSANSKVTQEQQTSKQNETLTQELQNLFNTVLKNTNNASTQTPNDQASQTQDQNSKQVKQKDLNKNTSHGNVAQTAVQVLAHAQYELANELEASLKKLRDVISESEKIANKISNLLGEESDTKKT